MQRKLPLNLDQLTVVSFETAQQPSAPEPATTCLQTDCGQFRCCA
ncbi:MAG TPA: hypothetical protein VGO40_13725 [Longimicrobium sp.]|nr:hypothetical protein [Longimicrobium sp.]